MGIKVTVVSSSPNRVSVNAPNQGAVRTIKQGQASRLSELTDVDTSDSDNNETLVYDEVQDKFVIKTIPVVDGGTF